MKLHYKKLGQGKPLIILHGLFGQLDNWQTLGKQFSENGFEVYLVDQRNHGHSPHSETWNYQAMSDDILELIQDNHLQKVILLGHSMGGKTAMCFALEHTEYIEKLIIADIAPKHYPVQRDVADALLSVDLNIVKSRKEVEEQLSKFFSDFGTKQFLLKNLYWKTEMQLAWRFNLEVISKNLEAIGESFITKNKIASVETLFLRGEKSNYILDEDREEIKKLFPNAEIKTIANAAHWLHADKPKEFFEEVVSFVK